MRKLLKDILDKGQVGEEYVAKGWVRSRRDSKGLSFLVLGDGSSMQTLQVVLGAEVPGYDALLPVLGTGLAPVVQWLLVPWLSLWYLRRLHQTTKRM